MRGAIRDKAYSFCKEYRIIGPSVSVDDMDKILDRMGYQVIDFDSALSDDDVALLVGRLGLIDEIHHSRGFVFANGKYRLVFVNENLSEEERRIVLLHEIGHIYCGHMSGKDIIGKDVMDEHEANEFVHYVLAPGLIEALKRYVCSKRGRGVVLVFAIIILSITMGVFSFLWVQKKNAFSGYYVTETGTRYHLKECPYVKGKANVHRLSKDELRAGDYAPCSKCVPH